MGALCGMRGQRSVWPILFVEAQLLLFLSFFIFVRWRLLLSIRLALRSNLVFFSLAIYSVSLFSPFILVDTCCKQKTKMTLSIRKRKNTNTVFWKKKKQTVWGGCWFSLFIARERMVYNLRSFIIWRGKKGFQLSNWLGNKFISFCLLVQKREKKEGQRV